MNGNGFSKDMLWQIHIPTTLFLDFRILLLRQIFERVIQLCLVLRQIHEEYLQPTFDKVYGFYTTDEAEKCIFLSRYNCNIYLELDTNSCH